jgi:hypothetical protein
MPLSLRAIKAIIKEFWYQKMSGDLKKKMIELVPDPGMQEEYKSKFEKFKSK